MPPKVRRPAAAGNGVRRRPAARVRGVEAPEWTKAEEVKLEQCPAGQSLVLEGEYWEAKIDLAGVVVGARVEGTQRYLRLRATGTRSEVLLKSISGSRHRELDIHLCGDPCDSKTWSDGLVHALRIKKAPTEREDWFDNLGEMRVEEAMEEDQNAELRREAEKARLALEGREQKRQEAAEGLDLEKRKKKKKKESKRLKASSAKKDLSLVFGGTGLDPDPSVRRLAIRRAKKVRKKLKKKRRRSSSSSKESTSMSSTSSSSEVMVDTELFEGQRETHKLWKRAPGTLSVATVLEAQQSLLTRQGYQPDATSGALPPILVQYYRAHLQPVMTPALSREAHHWSLLVDLLLKGEIARGCDLACQRLKSLEAYAKGVVLDISRQLELVPPEKASLTSLTETNQAGKLAQEESKVMQRVRYTGTGKGGEASTSAPGGKKGKQKGDGKKGKTDYKGQRKGKEEVRDKAA